MRKILFLSVFILFPAIASIAQQRVDYSQLEKKGKVHYYNDIPFTGEVLQRANNTNDPLIVDFEKGVAQGWMTAYYDESYEQVKWRVSVVRGKQHGVYTHYNEGGDVQFTVRRRRDMMSGERRCYYDDGTLWHVHRYRCDKQNGVMLTYNEDGSLHVRKRFRNDVLYGMCEVFLPDGTREKGCFNGGERDGVWKIYNPAGKITQKIRFVNGQQLE